MSLFKLGKTVITQNALAFCRDHDVSAQALLDRHVNGDWGDLDDEDKAANDAAVNIGSRILSSYKFPGARVWIITEADRSSTCILLPEDY